MQIPHLHDWPTTEAEAVALQNTLATRVDVSPRVEKFEYVAGCDIAYHITEPVLFAAVVTVRTSDRTVIETHTVTREVTFPYVPGLLSFREIPALLDTFANLRQTPDAVMLDGQGIAHPRRFGLACHLGLWLGLPCLGCAKSWLIGDHDEPGPNAGDVAPLTIGGEPVPSRGRASSGFEEPGETPRRGTGRAATTGGEPVGAVLRSASGANPVYVSPGHKIDLASAIEVVRATLSGYRHPTPTREAHMAANALRQSFRV